MALCKAGWGSLCVPLPSDPSASGALCNHSYANEMQMRTNCSLAAPPPFPPPPPQVAACLGGPFASCFGDGGVLKPPPLFPPGLRCKLPLNYLPAPPPPPQLLITDASLMTLPPPIPSPPPPHLYLWGCFFWGGGRAVPPILGGVSDSGRGGQGSAKRGGPPRGEGGVVGGSHVGGWGEWGGA